jgi:putative spermidine/putrescine transport system ATP-binding protein/spermidine/putrescine transport system ATP-binding protein
MAEALELASISKRFGPIVAVEPLTLKIEAGTLLALLGPSGCGKTTTLRIVAGFERSDTGHVRIGRREVTREPPNRRRLGMVFQNYSLFPHMTVGQNIAFGLKMARVSRSELPERVSQALALVRLQGLEERYPAQLSGGQQQRVALARALVTSPAVLLLDEPLGALDKNLRESMQFELRQIQQRLGITTVLVTHDQEEALTMSDAVAVMNEGRILQVGAPHEVYARPVNRFVSEFLGTSNIFEARALSNELFFVEAEAASFQVKGPPSPTRRSGNTVVLAIRPEKLRISAASERGANQVVATVTNRVFRGIYHAYQLKLAGREEPLVAYRQGEAGDFQIGAEVYVSWMPEDVVLLSEESHA